MAEALPDVTTRLLEARLKLHKLLTSQETVVSISYGDRSVQYRNYVSDIAELRKYIHELEVEAGEAPVRRPMGIVW